MLVTVTGLFGFRLGRTAELPIPGVNHTERRCVVAAHRRTQDVRCQTTGVYSLVRTLYFLNPGVLNIKLPITTRKKLFPIIANSVITRMHSSRMGTARLLTVSRTIGGGAGGLPRGVYLEGVSAQMGLSTWRVSARGGGVSCNLWLPRRQNSWHTLVKTLPSRN